MNRAHSVSLLIFLNLRIIKARASESSEDDPQTWLASGGAALREPEVDPRSTQPLCGFFGTLLAATSDLVS
jgi:hypothetical protein